MLKKLWKSGTAWLYANAALFLAWSQVDPVTALMIYSLTPQAIQDVLPANIFMFIGVVLFVLAVTAQIVKRKNGKR